MLCYDKYAVRGECDMRTKRLLEVEKTSLGTVDLDAFRNLVDLSALFLVR